ncbi:MAG TPA: glycosyltransferase [Catalimonadaceae bacterium]|nr:glycosyltransferase [Catalimonadaceae bacterium]
MGSPVNTIFYFYTRQATFIDKDLAMLREKFRVITCAFPDPEKWKTPFLFLQQIFFLIRHIGSWRQASAMCQFAGYHSAIPSLWAWITGRPSIIVVGGTDCVSFPSLKYGHFQNRLLAFFTRLSYRLVKTVSAVHSSLFLRDNPYAGEAERKQGILHFMPDAKFVKNEIPNGFNTQWFCPEVPFERRPPLSFISISVSLDDSIRVRLKGIDTVLELAKRMPDARFTLIGTRPVPHIIVPSNVELVPYVENARLKEYYNRNRYYLQLSLSEGFPNALCEAMACGCIPVVSAVASMPEIAGEWGTVLPERNPDLLEEILRTRLQKSDSEEAATSALVSESIARRYSWERRKTGLWDLMGNVS